MAVHFLVRTNCAISLTCIHIEKKLGNTFCVTMVKFGLTFSYIQNVFKQNCLINQQLHYLKLLQRENDEYQAITAAASGHLGYRNLIYDFRTPFIILATNVFHEV